MDWTCTSEHQVLEAVRNCAPGDRILVGPGTYEFEIPLQFWHTNFELVGSGRESTLLRSRFNLIQFHRVEETGTIAIANLTFEAGRSDGSGAAFFCENLVISFSDVHFRNNQLFDHPGSGGGAVALRYADARFERCVFTGNRAPVGGAVSVMQSNKLEFLSCFFDNNQADQGGDIFAQACREVKVIGCTFGERGRGVSRIQVDCFSTSTTDVELRGNFFGGTLSPLSGNYALLLNLDLQHNLFPPGSQGLLQLWDWDQDTRRTLVGGIPQGADEVDGRPILEVMREQIGSGNTLQNNAYQVAFLDPDPESGFTVHPRSPAGPLPPAPADLPPDLQGKERPEGSPVGCWSS